MEGSKESFNDCYYSCIDITDYNSKNKKVIPCPNLPSGLRSIGHSPDLLESPVAIATVNLDNTSSDESPCDKDEQADNEFQSPVNSVEPQLYTQTEVNGLARDLGLKKGES